MSAYAIINAAITPGLTTSERLIYLYIVGRANGAGVCWPSVATICTDLGMSRRTVMNGTKALAALSLIRIKARYQDTNNYFVVNVAGRHDAPSYADRSSQPERVPMPYDEEPPEQILTPSPEPEVQNFALMGSDECKKGRLTVQNLAPQTVQQESNKVSTSLRSVRARDPSLTDRIADARAVWNEVCVKAGLPACREMSDTRRKALQRALETRFSEPDAWPNFCRTIASSAFLTAGGFGIDWMLKPANTIKILEGNYGERRTMLRESGVTQMQRNWNLPPMEVHFDPEPEADPRRLVQ